GLPPVLRQLVQAPGGAERAEGGPWRGAVPAWGVAGALGRGRHGVAGGPGPGAHQLAGGVTHPPGTHPPGTHPPGTRVSEALSAHGGTRELPPSAKSASDVGAAAGTPVVRLT